MDFSNWYLRCTTGLLFFGIGYLERFLGMVDKELLFTGGVLVVIVLLYIFSSINITTHVVTYDCTGVEAEVLAAYEMCLWGGPDNCTTNTKKLICKGEVHELRSKTSE